MSAQKDSQSGKMKTIDLVYIGVFAALIAVCSWISIPMAVPFTLQTFAVFLAVGLLGGRRGTLAVLVYILMGAVGLPVFAGFTAGLGRLLGMTGGYILGFLGSALVMWGLEAGYGKLRRNAMNSASNDPEPVKSNVQGSVDHTRVRTSSSPLLLLALSMVLGLIVCYLFGTVWFVAVYAKQSGPIGFGVALGKCVVPFILPDLVKIALALGLTSRLKRFIAY